MSEVQILSPCSLYRPAGDAGFSAPATLPVRLGDIIEGTVVRSLGSHRAWMKFADQTLLVESQIPLPQETDLLFSVQAVRPRIVLKLLGEGAANIQIFQHLRKYLSADVPLAKIMENLSPLWGGGRETLPPSVQGFSRPFQAFIERFSIPGGSSPNPVNIRELLANSGVFWEAKVREWIEGERTKPFSSLLEGDFKGLNSRLLGQISSFVFGLEKGSAESQAMRDLAGGLEGIVRKIEFYQILTHQLSGGQEKIFLVLPLWVGSHLQFVELNLSFPSKEEGSGGEEEFSLLFLLQLPDLGKLRVAVKVCQKTIYCVIHASDPAVSRFLKNSTLPLEERLAQIGFSTQIQVEDVREDKAIPDFLEEVEGDLQSLLSIMV